jgi:hypothetical protein
MLVFQILAMIVNHVVYSGRFGAEPDARRRSRPTYSRQ